MSYLNLFIAALLTITFSFNSNIANAASSEQVDGGPRTVIQAMNDVIVEQETVGYLETTIVNSDGNAVIQVETESRSTVISVEGLAQGVYTVETIDDNGDYQEFSITIE